MDILQKPKQINDFLAMVIYLNKRTNWLSKWLRTKTNAYKYIIFTRTAGFCLV